MRYLSGIQPSGPLHLGNYFGAMRQHVARQNEHQCFYFIADFHALTTVQDPKLLSGYVRGVALDYLACGLDPEKVAFFRQSDVSEVTELAWILSTVTPMGLLERCHSYKDKVAKGISPSHGLFAYPVLMAADILIYDSNRVPVGKDQVQHVEVACDIAQSFNHRFGPTLVIPEHEVEEATAVVPGIDGQKMSKSYGNTIEMFAPEKNLKKAVMAIVTDSKTVEEPKNPEENIVYQLYSLMAGREEAEAMAGRFRAGGYGYGEAKKALLEKIIEYFGPFRRRREEIARDPATVENILQRGAEKARQAASQTMDRVRRAAGLKN
ncbi:MAG: tryptophan--tRNA ligase [Planctomycetes bacterium]|nr:tryptophan--tRNA ligase [Planctomycetota bacterium]